MSNKDQITIYDIMKRIRVKKKNILTTFLVSFIVSCLLILPVPRYYKCEVELAPESSSTDNKSSIDNIASTLGFGLGSFNAADAIYPDMYPELLTSNDFIFGLLNNRVKTLDNRIDTTYYQYMLKYQKENPFLYPVKSLKKLFIRKFGNDNDSMPKNIFKLSKGQTQVLDKIRKNIDCKIDIKTNLITITFKDQDPLVAATMADSINVRLQNFITNYRTGKARKNYAYYQKLTAQAKAKYEEARRRYGSYSDSNTDVLLESVKSNIDDLENDMQLKFNAYSSLNNQLQAAHAKVLESTPAFTIIKSPTVPIKPSGPKRMAFVAACVLLSIIICVFYINRDLFISSLKK